MQEENRCLTFPVSVGELLKISGWLVYDIRNGPGGDNQRRGAGHLIKRLKRFACAQTFVDVGAVSFLIYLSGGVDSLFSFLYMPVIISSAVLLHRRGSLFAASMCSVFYGLLLDSTQRYAFYPDGDLLDLRIPDESRFVSPHSPNCRPEETVHPGKAVGYRTTGCRSACRGAGIRREDSGCSKGRTREDYSTVRPVFWGRPTMGSKPGGPGILRATCGITAPRSVRRCPPGRDDLASSSNTPASAAIMTARKACSAVSVVWEAHPSCRLTLCEAIDPIISSERYLKFPYGRNSTEIHTFTHSNELFRQLGSHLLSVTNVQPYTKGTTRLS